MTIQRVVDIEFESIVDRHYDVAVFASGYEERCTFIPRQLKAGKIASPVVFGFPDLAEFESRIEHDRYYASHWITPKVVSSSDDFQIQSTMNEIASTSKSLKRILVDCSSMSRLWYAGLLNWARFSGNDGEQEIDFVYSVGKYEKDFGDAIPAVIEDVLSIPGCEGGPLRPQHSIAIFGLGFNGWATLSVLERLEADEVYAYIASPGAAQGYPERVRKINRDFLAEPRVKGEVLELPLRSVETCYRYLSELVSPRRLKDSIVLVPMGPKPHVLASILVSMRFPQVSCMRVGVRRPRPEKVSPNGEVVAARVTVASQ